MANKMGIILVTCEDKAGGSADDEHLRSALRAQGVEFETRVWSDPTVDWSSAQAVVIRTTWDYQKKLEHFLTWAQKVSGQTRVYNPLSIIRWNSSKHYLLELEALGLPIVPTRVFSRLEDVQREVPELRKRWERLILKPAVSASAELTYLIGGQSEWSDQARAILTRGDLLLQPFIESIGTQGELSLIYVHDGLRYGFSHAVLKAPASGDFRVQADFGGSAVAIDPGEELKALGLRALEALPTEVLFARVDLVDWQTGPLIGELELIEPELFFRCNPRAAAFFVRCLTRKLELDSRNT